MNTKAGVTAVAAVVLLAGCAGSGEAEKTVTVTASASSKSEATEPADGDSTASAPAATSSGAVDCDNSEDLSQAEWIDNCSDDPALTGEPAGEDSGSAMAEPASVGLDEAYTYPDGLKVTVKNWRAGADSNVEEPYVVFDTVLENTGTEPITVSYWESATYGDTGKSAMSVLADEWEDNGRRLQPGAKDTITATLDVASTEDPATVMFEFYDEVTYETPRPAFYLNVNGGIQ